MTDEEKELEAQLAELNEIAGVVKWTHVPFFGVPTGTWKVWAIWDQAYYDTAEYVIQGVVDGKLRPRVHGVVGVFLFRHFVELVGHEQGPARSKGGAELPEHAQW